jgi:putative transcriptional regulator
MSKAGRKIIAALQEGLEALESGEPLENRFTVRYYTVPGEPSVYDGPSIRAVRDEYAMSQGVFARFLCVSPATVQSWEQGRRSPSPIARRLLDEMVACPDHFRARFAEMAAPKVVEASPARTRSRRPEKKPRRTEAE